MLSHRLPVFGLVGYYPTNYLIGRKLLPERRNLSSLYRNKGSVRGIRPDFSGLSPSPGHITYVLLSRLPLARGRSPSPVRLACIRRTASVRPEPGSNSTDLFWVLVLSTIQLLRCRCRFYTTMFALSSEFVQTPGQIRKFDLRVGRRLVCLPNFQGGDRLSGVSSLDIQETQAPTRGLSRFFNVPPALRYPKYRAYWLGMLASVGGFQVLMFAQGWLTYELTGSPLYLGYVSLASASSSIALNLFGGVFADKLDKRRLIFVTQLITASLIFLLRSSRSSKWCRSGTS